jgi:hypothetical protein
MALVPLLANLGLQVRLGHLLYFTFYLTLLIYLFAESNVLQPNIKSRMSSFITVIEKGKKIGKVLWIDGPWLEFKPLPPSFISILDESINFIPHLNS